MIDLALFTFFILGACLSPGPCFALVMSYALRLSRQAALQVSLGIAIAFFLQALYCLWAIDWVMHSWPHAMSLIEFLGACYLLYLGLHSLGDLKKELPAERSINGKWPFFSGFMVNMLNPQAILFLAALFREFVHPATSPAFKMSFVAIAGVSSLSWYSFLSWLLTHSSLFSFFQRVQRRVLIVLGLFLILLSLAMFYAASMEFLSLWG